MCGIEWMTSVYASKDHDYIKANMKKQASVYYYIIYVIDCTSISAIKCLLADAK